jgi:hypothetical protein
MNGSVTGRPFHLWWMTVREVTARRTDQNGGDEERTAVELKRLGKHVLN